MNARFLPLVALAALLATDRAPCAAADVSKTLVFRAASPSSGAPLSLDAATAAAAVVVKRCAHAGIDGVTSGPNAGGDAVEIRLAAAAVEREAMVRRFIGRAGVVEFRIRADAQIEAAAVKAWTERSEGPPDGLVWVVPESAGPKVLVEAPERPLAAKLRRLAETSQHDRDTAPLVAAQSEYDKALVESVFTGADIAAATVERKISTYGAYTRLRISVRFEFKETRKAAFEKFTGGHVGRALAVVLDGKVHVCPVIKSAIPGEGQWIGPGNGYTDEEAAEIAALLACGPMPCNLVPEKGK